jgi:hypothetical protein
MPSRRSRPDPRTDHRPAERNGPRWPADCRGAEAADDVCRVEPDAIDEGGAPRVVPRVHPGKYSPRTRSRPPVPGDPAHPNPQASALENPGRRRAGHPPSTWTGSTPGGRTPASAASRPPSTKPPTTLKPSPRPRLDPTTEASTKPGAIHRAGSSAERVHRSLGARARDAQI